MSKRQSKGRMGLKILQFLLLITRAGFLSIVDVKFALALKTKLKKANCRVRLLWYQKTIPLYITTGAFACLDAIRTIKLSSQEKKLSNAFKLVESRCLIDVFFINHDKIKLFAFFWETRSWSYHQDIFNSLQYMVLLHKWKPGFGFSAGLFPFWQWLEMDLLSSLFAENGSFERRPTRSSSHWLPLISVWGWALCRRFSSAI